MKIPTLEIKSEMKNKIKVKSMKIFPPVLTPTSQWYMPSLASLSLGRMFISEGLLGIKMLGCILTGIKRSRGIFIQAHACPNATCLHSV